LTLFEVIEDVTAAEAGHRPPGVLHSIGTLVQHSALWKDVVRERLAGRAVDIDDPATNFPAFAPASWDRVRAAFEQAHTALAQAVAELSDSRLDDPLPGGGGSAWHQVTGAMHHDLYHAGQVALIRRALRGVPESEASLPAPSG